MSVYINNKIGCLVCDMCGDKAPSNHFHIADQRDDAAAAGWICISDDESEAVDLCPNCKTI